jgi:DNA-directed RNA polymerase subunit N (RpoN/RPB10)
MLGAYVCLSCNRRLSSLAEKMAELQALGKPLDVAMQELHLHPVKDMCCRRILTTARESMTMFSQHDDRSCTYDNSDSFRFPEVIRKVECV